MIVIKDKVHIEYFVMHSFIHTTFAGALSKLMATHRAGFPDVLVVVHESK